MPIRRVTPLVLAGLLSVLIVAGPGAAAQGTTYKIRTATGVERLTLSGPTTLAGAPATLSVTMVVKWKAPPAGSYGIATLSRNPPAGQKRLCASNTCPTYGPMSGTAKITGSVTPTGGGAAVSCASTKSLTSVFGKGSSSLAQTIEIYKKGSARLVGFTPSQYSFILQETVPDPACRVFLDETTLGSAATDPFPVSKLGDATLNLAVRATIPVAVSGAQPGAGVTGKVAVTFLSTLKRL
jgi:hypothetical protein